jgi:hypothetical protein
VLDRPGAGKPLDFRQIQHPAIAIPRPAITIAWPDGRTTTALPGQDWLEAARQAAVLIPTGCLGGSCGACEIEVNGRMVRACVATVPSCSTGRLTVGLASDPHW